MEKRRAQNEVLFREVNERIEAISHELSACERPPARLELVCECGRGDCSETLEATVAQYESVRANPRRFLVIPGHEDTETAPVVERANHFFVVEKLEEEGEFAVEHDPRR